MLGSHGRSLTRSIFTLPAVGLHKLGVTANQVTIAGTCISVALAVGLLARGYLWIGGVTLGITLFADSLDGILARLTNTASPFGAFLDSCLDRIADGAVFGSLLYWIIFGMTPSVNRTILIISAIITLIGAASVPYVRAKAENLGIIAKGGLAERTDRLVIVLVAAGLYDLGLPLWLFTAGFVWVALASLLTVFYRLWLVAKQYPELTAS